MVRIASVNVNGIRAAYRRGMGEWLTRWRPDVLAMQEVRAPDDVVRDLLGGEWQVAHTEAAAQGRAGVLVATRTSPSTTRIGVGDAHFDDSGRWVESEIALPSGKRLAVASAYVHTGEPGTPLQDEKYRFLDAMLVRMRELRERCDYALVVGDLNIGHTERDIKNWKGNLKKSGFLPTERAYLDRIRDELGWIDVGRDFAGAVDGPYTWWSYRGKAFDNDAGWRIDYQLATPELASLAGPVVVDRAPTYAQRWSDHAPVVVDYAA
ncbi:exodeoxyribonuclease III [Solicola gregarius]|uniref:Exodeoxyribonuclease III n=1 Tax=Solicola gregarius TaxID=2908642 RepID=A0AA46TL43_9ACTN|nr:exodeoxyribonuclease III [Solicola gregarius]UYM06919.1 exodeoxyribonuclease III [Solicola gregarius]